MDVFIFLKILDGILLVILVGSLEVFSCCIGVTKYFIDNSTNNPKLISIFLCDGI